MCAFDLGALLRRWHDEIRIPAAFMLKSDADVLKSLLVTSDQPKEVYVILDWADVLPKAERVCVSLLSTHDCNMWQGGACGLLPLRPMLSSPWLPPLYKPRRLTSEAGR